MRKAIILLVIGFIALGTAGFVVAMEFAARQFDFAPLLAQIENGTIKKGSNVSEIQGLGKPTANIARGGLSGAGYFVSVYEYNHEILVIYVFDRELFAACHYVGVKTSLERWLFCDVERFCEYLQSMPGSRR